MSEPLAELVARVSRTLGQAGIDSPRADAEALIAHALGIDASELRRRVAVGAVFGDDPDGDVAARIDTLVTARAAREPLQHILGYADFAGLRLEVGPGVFVPRPETELLVERAVAELAGVVSPVVVDLCAGSGAIGLALAARVPGATVTLVELHDDAGTYLRRNAATLARMDGAASTPHVIRADATAPELLAELAGAVDLAVSNPPYVPPDEAPAQPEALADPATALYGGGADGMDVPRAVIAAAARLLRDGGVLLMEHSPSQREQVLAAAQPDFDDAVVVADLAGRDRYLRAVRRPRSGDVD